jgi:hypothetical protein
MKVSSLSQREMIEAKIKDLEEITEEVKHSVI